LKRRRGLFFWAVASLVCVLVFVVTFLLIASTHQNWTVSEFASRHPAPGKLVSVGTHSLHLHCTGTGDRTVILESGSGMWSLDWHLVQTRVSRFAHVCSYDRAGFGWSEAGPEPRDISQIVKELHDVALNAELRGSFIIVGASFG
jgi:pimeloyl-ACP methyl ester carboxylesterase|tara:strand:- start:284 stop:718 length:435 start_codon:yes stop_codon:yes gene_type:complete